MSQLKTKFIADDAITSAKFKLDNDGALRARNNADSADVNLLKLDTSDILQFLSHPRISTSSSNADDVVTQKDLDANLDGIKHKEAVRVASTANGTLASDFENGDTMDGVTLATGDRILLKDQTDASENGIYVVAASGAPTRSTDMDSVTSIDEVNKASVFVQEGTTQTGYAFVQYGTVVTLDTDDLTFAVRANQSILGGDGIDVTGSTISVDHDGEGLTIDTNQLALEIDGGTLSKSVSGLKVADNGIDESQLSSNIDAESFVLSAGYASSAGTVTIGDSIEVAIEKLNGNVSAIDTSLSAQEDFTLIAGDITNGYVDLAETVNTGSVILTPSGGPMQIEGIDYTLSDGGGFTRVTFAGDLISGDSALVATDVIHIKYSY
jgi:hypothetical protein